MNRSCHLIVFAIVIASTGVTAGDAANSFQSSISNVLKANCIKCHGPEKQKAKINLSGARTAAQLAAEKELWFRVLDQIESGNMPPEEEKQPSAAERQAIAGWIRGDFIELLAVKQHAEGRSKLRRLSRTEYANTVQDLFGIRPTVGLNLPDDGKVDGYDKVSGALPLSAFGTFGYFKMSEEILKWMLRPIPKPKAAVPPAPNAPADPSRIVKAEAQESGQSAGHSLKLEDGTIVSFNSDTTSGRLNYGGPRVPGMHKIRVSVYGYQTDKPMPFGVYVGHTSAYPQILDLLKILEAPPGKAAVIETEIYLRTRDLNDRVPVGDSIRLIPFGIGVQVPKNSFAKDCKGPGFAVQWIEVEEPEMPNLGDRWLTADFPKALSDEMRRSKQFALPKPNPKKNQPSTAITTREEFLAVMQTTFKRIGARFYRRDLTAQEIDPVLADIAKQIDSGAVLENVFFDKVTEMMTSPDFFCVIEQPGQLTDFALASRLSYFLWNSTPDDVLLELARKGKLRDPKVLKEQTERLLNDPKSERFVNDFVNQWLGLRAINDTSPDPNLYPDYDELLKLSSVMETQGFFRRVLTENLSVRNFVTAPWALLNEPLAKHYGVPDVKGMQLQKVSLPDASPYSGIWTQSAIMKVTANGTNTSPVKRGVWVAERLLGIPIPPPPPNIKPVEPDVRGAKTLREQLALHSSGGSCTSCHAKFDPYGFALESFDVTGSFRKNYREANPDHKGKPTWRDGLPVDCSGKMPDGRPFTGIAELRQLLAKNPEQLARGVTRHLVTYATGSPASIVDQSAIDRIVKSAAADDYGLRSLIHALVQSELFRWK